jgi:hypothetical protein
MKEAASVGDLSYQTGDVNLTATTALIALGGLVVAAFTFIGIYGWLLSGSVSSLRCRRHYRPYCDARAIIARVNGLKF